MLHFNPTTGLYPDDVSTVRETVRSDWVSAFQREGEPELDTDPSTPAGQLVDSQTAHIVEKDDEVLFLANQFNPLTSEGVFQDALAKIYFISRKRQQSSVAICTVTGLEGTIIPIGAQIKSSTDQSVWACAAQVTIPAAGSTSATFVALNPGPLVAGAETLTEIVTITPGWDSVINPSAATVGRDEETQMEFEQRRYDSVAINARGSLSAIFSSISQVEGVIDCVVLENITNETITSWGVEIPGHSIWATVVGGDDTDIAEVIYRKKDAGCGTSGNTAISYQDIDQPMQPIYTYLIERPENLAIKFRVYVQQVQNLPVNAETLIKDAILKEFNGQGPHGTPRVSFAQTVFVSRFFCSVVEVAKISSLESIEISSGQSNSWSDSIVVNANKNPVLDEDDITIIIS